MTDLLVSIIIPVYKTEKWLTRCIESCINQTYTNIEVILVDDGSPDNCKNICDKYARKDKRVISIHQPNGGVSSARNSGLDHATGDYIMFVDSDDWIHSTSVEKLIELQNKEDYDLVVAGFKRLIDNEEGADQIPPHLSLLYKDNILNFISTNPDYFHSAWMKLYKKDIIKKYNVRYNLELKLGEDGAFVWKYLEYCNKLCLSNEALYYYRIINNNAKNMHYQLGDAEFQWKNTILLYKNYKKLFLNTRTYIVNKINVNLQLIVRIKQFLNSSIYYRADKTEVIHQLASLPHTGLYNDILDLSFLDCSDLLERLVLLCCKSKQWILLYYIFKAKVYFYNLRLKTE